MSLLLSAALSACGLEGVDFYEVRRAPTEECDILPQGEFCVTPDELSSPVFEVWSVERRGDALRIFVDDEVWIADVASADMSSGELSSEKQELTAVAPGPCTTTWTRQLVIVITRGSLTGTLQEKRRLDGPAACGDMPRGERTASRIDGTATGAP